MKFLLYSACAIVLFIACYEDKGNYNYVEDVNTFDVDINKVYGILKRDTTYVIRPVVRQSDRANNANLRYVWRMSTVSDVDLGGKITGDTLSLADTVGIVIDTRAADFKYTYWLRFYVEDMESGAKSMYPVTVSVVKPYEGAWMVFHKDGEHTKLGAIEYVGNEMVITDDAFFKERGTRLQGNPVKLGAVTEGISAAQAFWGFATSTIFYCFTDLPSESGVYRPENRFMLMDDRNIQHMIYPSDYSGYLPSNVTYLEGTGSPLIISNGKGFQGSVMGPRLYGMPLDPATVSGDYYISHLSSGGATNLAFDMIGRRFLQCYTGNNVWYPNAAFRWTFLDYYETRGTMKYIANSDANALPDAQLRDIGEDKEMVYIGTGYYYGPNMTGGSMRTSIYALAKSKTKNESYIYDFHGYPLILGGSDANDPAPLAGFYAITTPPGLTSTSPCTSSVEYNRILFYAVGNRIYRLDFGVSGGRSLMIWQHPDAGAEAKVMQMARKDWEASGKYPDYGHNPNRSLGIVFDMPSGRDEVIILNLDATGRVDDNGKYPSVQVHQGFGKIKDVIFI